MVGYKNVYHPFNERRIYGPFENGYSASVIRGPNTYGGPEGLWELAVLRSGKLCYTPPITDDIIGHLTEKQVEEIVEKIKQLGD